jgi:hypothetical protein
MHINVKAPRLHVYETPEQAIEHILVCKIYPKDWLEVHFGRDLAQIRKVTTAIQSKDYSAFEALPRKGYWRVQLRNA